MRNRSGFTLIELLIVVVIIGLLAAIALPKFGYTKQKAFTSTMKSDLRNLATAQEAYWNDNGSYYVGALPSSSIIRAVSWLSWSDTSASTTLAPSRAKASAVVRPMPLPAPVTNATLPTKLPFSFVAVCAYVISLFMPGA